MMADVQEWFIAHQVRNFYSVSISGYHIAEAGANPISQLAFTLANGFTYVESYLARGMAIDDFAPNLSFFFSNGMDAEYTVLGRVARRIWAVALRERYGATERRQKLKYHVQTSGRSLHAQEMDFNDIRTTLQALCAIYDNANSLHTNAYDEAVTTPSARSVRRALAIQMIIDSEWGLAVNENPLQGSFVVDELTDLVEEAVLAEFERISERGGVLGAMETGYQRGRIQDESMLYEQRKHDGTLPIVGVNTFLDAAAAPSAPPPILLARGTEAEKQSQLRRLADFQRARRSEARPMLDRLRAAATTAGTRSRRSWTPSGSARSARSSRRSSRSAASTVGRCDHVRMPPWRAGSFAIVGRRDHGRISPSRAGHRTVEAHDASPAALRPGRGGSAALGGARLGGGRRGDGRRHVAHAGAADRARPGRGGAAAVRADLRPLRGAHAPALQRAREPAAEPDRATAPGAPGERDERRRPARGAGPGRRAPHPTDRRATLVALTDDGHALASKATEALNATVFAQPGLSPDEVARLVDVLTQMRRSAGDF